MLLRWLDPPEVRERKRRIRAGLLPRPEPAVREVGVAVPIGCLVPLAIAAVVLVGAGVFLGTRLAPAGADHVVVRVIDDGAAGGPQVVSTQIVPVR